MEEALELDSDALTFSLSDTDFIEVFNFGVSTRYSFCEEFQVILKGYEPKHTFLRR